MALIESSAQAASENNVRIALERAREASSREKALIRLQEQAGLSDNHNIDLTFAVSLLNSTISTISFDTLSTIFNLSLYLGAVQFGSSIYEQRNVYRGYSDLSGYNKEQNV